MCIVESLLPKLAALPKPRTWVLWGCPGRNLGQCWPWAIQSKMWTAWTTALLGRKCLIPSWFQLQICTPYIYLWVLCSTVWYLCFDFNSERIWRGIRERLKMCKTKNTCDFWNLTVFRRGNRSYTADYFTLFSQLNVIFFCFVIFYFSFYAMYGWYQASSYPKACLSAFNLTCLPCIYSNKDSIVSKPQHVTLVQMISNWNISESLPSGHPCSFVRMNFSSLKMLRVCEWQW